MRPFLVAALIGLAAALTAPAGANAASCWQRVLDDWGDGHLDHVYPVHCYRDALENMPEDLRVYGTAESDIQTALTHALARSAIDKHPAASVASPGTTTSADAPRAPTAAPGRDRTRTLAGHSAAQPKLRLAAPARDGTGGSGFPVTAVAAAVAALGAALLILASLHRYLPRRVRR
jgi:hypothetical protein